MELDGSIYDEEGERKPNLFCKLCKLLFNQSRDIHDVSLEHKAIFKFLNPSCEVRFFMFTFCCGGKKLHKPCSQYGHGESNESASPRDGTFAG